MRGAYVAHLARQRAPPPIPRCIEALRFEQDWEYIRLLASSCALFSVRILTLAHARAVLGSGTLPVAW